MNTRPNIHFERRPATARHIVLRTARSVASGGLRRTETFRQIRLRYAKTIPPQIYRGHVYVVYHLPDRNEYNTRSPVIGLQIRL